MLSNNYGKEQIKTFETTYSNLLNKLTWSGLILLSSLGLGNLSSLDCKLKTGNRKLELETGIGNWNWKLESENQGRKAAPHHAAEDEYFVLLSVVRLFFFAATKTKYYRYRYIPQSLPHVTATKSDTELSFSLYFQRCETMCDKPDVASA